MGAQLHSLRFTRASKTFWKIYFLYDFWCAQTCSFPAILGATRSIARTSYGNVSVCLAGWLVWVSLTAGIVSKRLNLPGILKLFPPSRRLIIEAFGTPCADTKFEREPLHRGRLIHGGWKKLVIFDGYCPLSRKRCDIGRWLLWNVHRKSWVLH